MVCPRCIMAVKKELEKKGVLVKEVELGKAVLESPLDTGRYNELKDALEAIGFEIIEDKKTMVVEEVKTCLIELLHHSKEPLDGINYSQIISERLSLDYKYISTLFSASEDITIEKYVILQKIEKVKELIEYNELTLGEIAYQMGYSSIHHLSNQFKKTTGYTPSQYIRKKDIQRNSIHNLR